MSFTNWKSSYFSDSQYNCVNIDSDGHWWVKTSRDLSAYTINYICEYSLVEDVTSSPATVDVTSVESASLLTGLTESDTTTNNEDVTVTLNNRDQGTDAEGASITLYVTIPAVVVALCGGVGIIWRVKKLKQIWANKSNKIEILELSPLLTAMLEDDVQMKLRSLLLHRSALELEQIQGRGAFGIVYRGRYSPVNHGLPAQSVAIKVLQANCIGSDIRGLVDEAVTMTDFNHAHVMSIIGVCIDPDEGLPMLVMPYMENADLNSYLRRFIFEKIDAQIPDEKQLLIFCLHIARGMEYLSGLKFIHRDLAARNCMIDSNLLVKVADFGLSRDVYTTSYYRQDEQKMLPVKWMSLESLQFGVFTSHSDIWSFGVTMWEIMSLGRIPYPEVNNSGMLKHLETGEWLKSPKNCPDEIYTIMSSCWQNNVDERPTFSKAAEQLMTYLARTCGYLEMDIKATTGKNEGTSKEFNEGTSKEFNIYSGDDRVTDTDTCIYDRDNKDSGDITNADEEKTGESNSNRYSSADKENEDTDTDKGDSNP